MKNTIQFGLTACLGIALLSSCDSGTYITKGEMGEKIYIEKDNVSCKSYEHKSRSGIFATSWIRVTPQRQIDCTAVGTSVDLTGKSTVGKWNSWCGRGETTVVKFNRSRGRIDWSTQKTVRDASFDSLVTPIDAKNSKNPSCIAGRKYKKYNPNWANKIF